MNLKNKSVVVTGGAGFIGSHLVEALAKKQPDNIIIIDNLFLGKEKNFENAKKLYPKLNFIKESVSDYGKMQEIFKNNKIDVVFNLAVIPLPASLEKPYWSSRENIDITLNICELARQDYFKKLIHYSSSEVYGTAKYVPMDEEHPKNPETPYAAAKLATDELALSYCRTFGIDVSVVRPFNNYGPRQNEKAYAGVIPITIKRILNNQSPIIFGDGKQTRDFIHVRDTALATIKLAELNNAKGKTLNIASGKETSIEYLISLIAKELDYKKGIIHKKPRPGDVRRHLADIKLAKKVIGFKPTIDIKDGIKETVKWYVTYLKNENK